jgi:hypothetical protein
LRIAWANGSLHHELHGHDDARARSTFRLQIPVLVAMAAFIPEAGGERGAAFAVAAAACLGVGAARLTPLVLGLALVLLLSIPWGFAVARRLADGAGSVK